jgi:hypothetical protein
MGNRLAWLACALLTSLTWSALARAEPGGQYTVVYQTAWRNGIDPRLMLQEARQDAISVVAMPQFDGAALKTSMLRSDDFSHIANGAPRVEALFTAVARFAIGNEYEVRWSTMIPPNYQLDALQPEIITQLHQSDYHVGSPPFSLMLAGTHYQMDVRGDPARPSQSFEFGAPTADEGKVVSWLLRYRPDDGGASAVTDLYKDGIRVVHAGAYPNAYPGDKNGYLKIGIYKWWWKTRPSNVRERTMYYGDVEIKERPANQELSVSWSDPQMRALVSTYDSVFAYDWRNGIEPQVSIQHVGPTDVAAVSDPVVAGRQVVRVSIAPNEDFSSAPDRVPQAALMFQSSLRFGRGKDYLIGWSTYIPPAFVFDSSPTIAQVHQGTSSGLPPIMLGIANADYTFSESGGGPVQRQPLFRLCCATADQGKWINWMLRYMPDATGRHSSTQLWKDGTLVYASRGVPNAYPDDDASYFKLGVYLPDAWQGTAPRPIALLFGPVSAAQR